MSGTGDNRWQRSGPPQQPQHQRQAPSRGSSGTGTGPGGKQDGAARPPQRQNLGSPAGNAWGPDGKGTRGGGSGGGYRGGPQQQHGGAGARTSTPAEAAHVPVRDFNAEEVRGFLKKNYLDASTAGPDRRVAPWKPQKDNMPKASPWASKANAMASGQDFWVQLRKQIAALEQGK